MGVLDDAIREHLELKLKHGAKEDEVRRQEAEALGAVRREPAPEPGPADAGAAPDEAGSAEPDHAPFETDASEAERLDDSELLAREEDETAFEERFEPRAPAEEGPIEEGPIEERGPDEYGAAREPADEAVFAEDEADEAGFVQRAEPAPEDTILIERGEEEVLLVEEGEPTVPGEPPLPDERSARDAVSEPPLEEGLADEEAALEAERSAEALDEARPREAHEAGTGDADDDVLEETPEFLQETPEHDRLWFEQKPPRDFDFD
ncbi:MAG: hypothetical protein ACM3UV_05435 [Nocardioidaceae bacterium]